jgi:hypothetical protein
MHNRSVVVHRYMLRLFGSYVGCWGGWLVGMGRCLVSSS